jgi:uncharacterized membrane protein (GlpM family)
MLYIIKLVISALLIVLISEVSKRDTWLAGLLASLPLVSLLAIVWLYAETHDIAKISAFSMDIFWLVLPSLSLFLVLPLMLKANFGFWPSLASALLVMFACYLLTMMLLRKLGVHP